MKTPAATFAAAFRICALQLLLPNPVQKPFQVPTADGVLQLADRFWLRSAERVRGHLEDASDFFEGVGVTVAETVAAV